MKGLTDGTVTLSEAGLYICVVFLVAYAWGRWGR